MDFFIRNYIFFMQAGIKKLFQSSNYYCTPVSLLGLNRILEVIGNNTGETCKDPQDNQIRGSPESWELRGSIRT